MLNEALPLFRRDPFKVSRNGLDLFHSVHYSRAFNARLGFVRILTGIGLVA
jgi:hypothetical protein